MEAPKWNSRLPEDYGEGQRQFDMMSAARRAAEPFVWTTSVFAGCAAAAITHAWPALLVAFPIYLLCMRPIKNALRAASDEWEKEREAWDRRYD